MASFQKDNGLLCYETSYNLGDEVQSLAANGFLPNVDYLVDRDSGKITTLEGKEAVPVRKIATIYNGWFDGQYTLFPPSEFIEPLFVSFHINETNHDTDNMYDILKKDKKYFIPIASHVDYFKRYEPIGCRDIHTTKMLIEKGIKAYFSGCLTLTLERNLGTRTDEILVIDAHINAPTLFNTLIPRNIKRKAIYLTQAVMEKMSHDKKMILAEERLNRIARAKLVITSRIHTAFPCLAPGINTPVIFLTENINDVRFAGMLKYLKTYTTGDKLDVNLENYTNPFNPELKDLIFNLKNRTNNWVDNSKEIKEGNSIFTACMDRNVNLELALPSWLATNPEEIVIVDWGSKIPVVDTIQKYNGDGKIKVITVPNVSSWVLTRSFNLAARFTQYSNLLKVDCDTMLEPDFFSYHNLAGNVFFAGDWRQARDANEKYTNGIVYMERKDFFAIGGYNEKITTYGWDDCDLYDKLSKFLKRIMFNLDCIKHIEHSNNERIVNQQLTYGTRLDIEIERNRLIAELGGWKGNFSHFEITTVSPIEMIAKYICSMELDEETRKKLLDKAVANREYALKKIEDAKDTLVVHIPDIKKKRIYINAKNGLGNRMRAFASAYNIGISSGREVVLIWIPDNHCGAKFTDLFKINNVLNGVIIMDVDIDNLDKEIVRYDFLENEYVIRDKLIYNFMGAERNLPIDDTTDKDIYIVSACVLKNHHTNWNKECAFLRKLEVIDPIAKQINIFERNYSMDQVIGVHIRMGQPPDINNYEDVSTYTDKQKVEMEKWRANSHWSIFLNEMKRIIRVKNNQKFFLCCDNPEAYYHIISEIKSNIISTPKERYDRSSGQIISAVIDVMLLAKTKYILGSGWSSFTELATRLGGNDCKIAGRDF
jgi:hypothetical protein